MKTPRKGGVTVFVALMTEQQLIESSNMISGALESIVTSIESANDVDFGATTKAMPASAEVDSPKYHPDQLLTVPMLAEVLGVKVGTIYTWSSKSPEKLPKITDIGTAKKR